MNRIISIFTSPNKGEPMISVPKVRAIQGRGLEGDRYESKTGAWSKVREGDAARDVSIITLDGITRIQELLGPEFKAEHSRRNILVDGISAEELVALVGKDFHLGQVQMRGAEICDPCKRPSMLSRIPGFEKVGDLAGLRASILNTADLEIGNCLTID